MKTPKGFVSKEYSQRRNSCIIFLAEEMANAYNNLHYVKYHDEWSLFEHCLIKAEELYDILNTNIGENNDILL